jgi:hypothetical protein
MFLKSFSWEVGSSNLLSNTASFSSLHIGSSQFIENQSFACIDMAEDTNNWAP